MGDTRPVENRSDAMSRTTLNDEISLYHLSPRQQIAQMRAARRRRTRRRVIHTLGAVLTLVMALGSWHLISNYRIVHDPRSGSTRLVTLKQLQQMKAESKASHKTEAKVAGSVTPRQVAARHLVAPPEPMVPLLSTDTIAADITPVGASSQPVATVQEAASAGEDPEGHVTSFFGIEVKNKDFLPQKGG